ncbi:MAG: Na/Pi cotransporter family protein [Bacteroidota bacterium]
MTFGIAEILSILGALGLFLFGMKQMSEGLQKVAGTRMRNTLAAITSNKFRSVLSGFVITGFIQSSSATTVMLVSFVNAGLISVTESIGIIMGANIGTTITAWLISTLGFNMRIGSLALPLIGLTFFLLFSSKNRSRYFAQFIIGFALIFLGLDFLKSTIPDISQNPGMLEFVSDYTHLGFVSILLFFVMGFLVTAIMQSSSLTTALTIVMCYKGWITFELAAAMIIGENVGTTITANLAAFVGNASSKISARAHFVFNLLGAIWSLTFLNLLISGIDRLMLIIGLGSPLQDVSEIPVALAIFHTSYNLLNVLILINFIPIIETISARLVRQKAGNAEPRLTYISTGILSTAEFSLLQGRKEILNFGKRTQKMFQLVRNLFSETNETAFQNIYENITNYENYSDQLEIEIANYLTRVSEGELSKPGIKRIRVMLKLVDYIESIADSCNSIAKTLRRKKKNKIWFTQELRNNLNEMFQLIQEALSAMVNNLDTDYVHFNAKAAEEIEKKINRKRKQLHRDHISNIEERNYTYEAGIIYTDILAQCENLGDDIYNVTKALVESNAVVPK